MLILGWYDSNGAIAHFIMEGPGEDNYGDNEGRCFIGRSVNSNRI